MIIKLELKKSLDRLWNAPEEAVRKAVAAAVRAAAERYTEMIHDWIDAGKAFTPRTGDLQDSIIWRPEGEDTAVISANIEYAPFVEHGTRAHEIKPRERKALRFPDPDDPEKVIFARIVNHPGSKAYQFFFADREQREHEAFAAAERAILKVLRELT